MIEAIRQSLQNLRANKLRSFLTMFGIVWGVVTIVLLSATGEGFRRGNETVLREFGKNIIIVRRGRTSLQAGGERAGRQITLNGEDARALQRESRLLETVSPEIMRYEVRIKSAYNAAALDVHGVEPQYQDIRTIDLEYGRHFNRQDEEQRHRVAILGADAADQLFGQRNALGEEVTLNGLPYRVAGKIRKKNQDSNYSGPDNTKVFVPFATMMRDLPALGSGYRPDSISTIICTPKPWVVKDIVENPFRGGPFIFAQRGPVEMELREILGRRHGFDPMDDEALSIWNTVLSTAMFDRIIRGMKEFFTAVGLVSLALGGLGVMNIMLISVRERTVEIGIRKALGARIRDVRRQFFLEGFFLTLLSGALGLVVGLGLCMAVNSLPMPERFSGMIVTWQTGLFAVAVLAAIGVLTSTYPAHLAAKLPPVAALHYER
ncbi:MAG: FtsX-like permease family protein [Acidobacteria bacterium]|nr:FtsX-like permease family protein [Acidobacteriota bacterium]